MKPNKRPHVLYVEDDEDACQMMAFILEMSGIDVSCAHGMNNALLMPDKDRFDVFLLDLWLKDGDGSDLCVRLRSEFPNIPVVFYTGCATERERKQGLLSGAAAYLVKPHSDLVAPTILNLSTGGGSVPRSYSAAGPLELMKQNALALVKSISPGRALPLSP